MTNLDNEWQIRESFAFVMNSKHVVYSNKKRTLNNTQNKLSECGHLLIIVIEYDKYVR